MRAGLATLSKMERIDGWTVLDERTTQFCSKLRARFRDANLPLTIVQQASIFWLHVTSSRPLRRVDALPETQAPWYGRFFHAALRRGVYLPPAAFEVCFLSMAHDVDTLTAAGEALVAAAVEAGAP